MKTKNLFVMVAIAIMSLVSFNASSQNPVCFVTSNSMSIGNNVFSSTNSVDADFNSDGILDSAFASGSDITVLLGDGIGGFGAPISLSISSGSTISIIGVDLNNDNKLDLVDLNFTLSGRVSVFLGDGTGNFDSPVHFTTFNQPTKITAADFDGDGKPDLAITRNIGDIYFLKNTIPFVSIISTDTICYGESITFTGSGATSYTYTNGVTNGIGFTPTTTATYTVTGITSNCSNTATKTITVNQLPISNAGTDLSICSGALGNIGTTPITGNAYSWNSNVGLNDSTISNPTNTTINNTSLPITTTYTVTTTITETGCQTSDNVIIIVNPQPELTITSPNAVCFPNTIDLTSSAITTGSTGGGVLSYWTDAGATNALLSPNAITISDTNFIKVIAVGGCFDIDTVFVIINPQPSATFTTLDESSSLYCDGSIIAQVSGGTLPIQSEWFDSNQNFLSFIDSIGALCPGTYTLNLTDSNSCVNSYPKVVQAGPLPSMPSVCLVTVDYTNTHNVIVWEKTNLNMVDIDSFIVYREVTTNNYEQIGAIPKDSLSVFNDIVNPSTTGYRYKLMSKNFHGATSVQSDYHNTIYLTNIGANFSWTPYQIEGNSTPVVSYNVYRDSNSTGDFIVIGNTTGNQFGYTVPDYSSFTNARYYVEAVMLFTCSPTRLDALSHSNITNPDVTGIQHVNINKAIKVFPNPATNIINIVGVTDNTKVRLYDMVGRLVVEKEVDSNTTIDTDQITGGIYTLSVESEIGITTNRIVINH